MRKAFYISLLSFLHPVGGFTQSKYPVVKVHAYQQLVHPGTIHANADQEGNLTKKKTKVSNDLIIYLETRNGWNITPVRLWLKDEIFETIPVKMNPPVIRSAGEQYKIGSNDTLVPSTSYDVINLALTKSNNTLKKNTYLQKLLNTYSAVIEYQCKEKTFYLGIKKFKELSPAFME